MQRGWRPHAGPTQVSTMLTSEESGTHPTFTLFTAVACLASATRRKQDALLLNIGTKMLHGHSLPGLTCLQMPGHAAGSSGLTTEAERGCAT